ncbi:MAG: hypothetical protein WCE68_09205 [Anaerolineales bacterium]
MTIEFDDKGKYFTDIISKTPIPVMLQTAPHRIHGNIHVSQDRRLKDELELPEKFIAVTDAIVYSPEGRILYQAKFLAVRRDEIIWVMPDSEIAEQLKGDEK